MRRWLTLIMKFMALWLFVFIAHTLLQLGFNLAFRGYIDLRMVTILEYILLPIGLTLVFWAAILGREVVGTPGPEELKRS